MDTQIRPLMDGRKPATRSNGRDVDEAEGPCSHAGMANVLGDEKRHQILTLGRLGWSLRRIEKETAVRRETASAYLRTAGTSKRATRSSIEHAPPSNIFPARFRNRRCTRTSAGRSAQPANGSTSTPAARSAPRVRCKESRSSTPSWAPPSRPRTPRGRSPRCGARHGRWWNKTSGVRSTPRAARHPARWRC